MKQIILPLIISLLFFSCVNKQHIKQSQKEYILKALVDSCVKTQPNAMNNDITMSILADSIKKTIQNYIGDTLPFLTEMPLKYEMNLEYPTDYYDSEKAGKYIVKFTYSELLNEIQLSKEYEIEFQVLTIMDKQTASKLINDSLYFVNGKFIDFANNSAETGFVLPSGKCLIGYPQVSKSSIDNKPYINLGTFIIDNAKFRKHNEKSN